MQRRNQTKNQSWDNVAPWYDKLTGNSGQYFHEHVIFQNVTRLLNVQKDDRILDLACGQGAYSRELAKQGARVTGVDSSKNLLDRAAHYKSENIEYVLDDARNLHKLSGTHFDAAVSILALQNIDPLDSLFTNVSKLLEHNGAFVIVILHPILRSPRITGWEEDPNRKIQFRRIDRYVTSMKIPITMHPGKTQGPVTWTYHRPLEYYVNNAAKAGLVVDALEEWTSDKKSEGPKAKTENLARSEIPLFMAIRYRKI